MSKRHSTTVLPTETTQDKSRRRTQRTNLPPPPPPPALQSDTAATQNEPQQEQPDSSSIQEARTCSVSPRGPSPTPTASSFTTCAPSPTTGAPSPTASPRRQRKRVEPPPDSNQASNPATSDINSNITSTETTSKTDTPDTNIATDSKSECKPDSENSTHHVITSARKHPVPLPRARLQKTYSDGSVRTRREPGATGATNPRISDAKLKQAFLQRYGSLSSADTSNKSYNSLTKTTSLGVSSRQSCLASGATSSAPVSLLRNKSNVTGSSARDSARNSHSNARNSVFSKTNTSSSVSSSSSSSRSTIKSKREDSSMFFPDDVHKAHTANRDMMADFLNQLKQEIEADPSSRSSVSSTSSGNSASSRSGSVSEASAQAPASSGTASSASNVRRGNKDKGKTKEKNSPSVFYTSGDNIAMNANQDSAQARMSKTTASAASDSPKLRLSRSKFYVTEERTETVETVRVARDKREVVSSRVVAHQQSTVTARRDAGGGKGGGGGISNITHRFENHVKENQPNDAARVDSVSRSSPSRIAPTSPSSEKGRISYLDSKAALLPPSVVAAAASAKAQSIPEHSDKPEESSSSNDQKTTHSAPEQVKNDTAAPERPRPFPGLPRKSPPSSSNPVTSRAADPPPPPWVKPRTDKPLPATPPGKSASPTPRPKPPPTPPKVTGSNERIADSPTGDVTKPHSNLVSPGKPKPQPPVKAWGSNEKLVDGKGEQRATENAPVAAPVQGSGASSATGPAPVAPGQTSGTTKPAPATPVQTSGATKPAPETPVQTSGATKPAPATPAQGSGATKPAPVTPAQGSGATKPAPVTPAQGSGATEPAPIAPVRHKKLERLAETRPADDVKQRIKDFSRAESEPRPPALAKSVSIHVLNSSTAGAESATAGEGVAQRRQKGAVARREAEEGRLSKQKRLKSLVSFTAEDTDIFQRASSELLLDDIPDDHTDSSSADPHKSSSSSEQKNSAAPTRMSRRDISAAASFSPACVMADKRRSRSLDPTQAMWRVRLAPKPGIAPKPAAKVVTPARTEAAPRPKVAPPKTPPKLVKVVAGVLWTSAENEAVYSEINSGDEAVYNDATSVPPANSKMASDDKNSASTGPVLRRHKLPNPTENSSNHEQGATPVANASVYDNNLKGVAPTQSTDDKSGDGGSEPHYERVEFINSNNKSAPKELVNQNETVTPQTPYASLDEQIPPHGGRPRKISSGSDSSCSYNVDGDPIYADVDDVKDSNGSKTSTLNKNEHIYEVVGPPSNAQSASHSTPSQPTANTAAQPPRMNLAAMKLRLASAGEEGGTAGGSAGVQRKISRKQSVKLTKKLSRKWTKKYGASQRFDKLKQLLQQVEDHVTDEFGSDAGDDEPLEFSDSESEWGDDDSLTDEEDLEFERNLLAQLPESDRVVLDEELNPSARVPKTQKVAQELLTTERSYVNKLYLIDQVYHNTIVLENRETNMVPPEVIPHMFSNVKSIYQFHHDFLLPQLEQRMTEWSKNPRIGDVMLKYAPFLQIYKDYVVNFSSAMSHMENWREKSPRFAKLLQDLKEREESGKLDVQHHMLGPIQRVPRYELLLKEYLKHLPEDSDDRADTEKALEKVTSAALSSNNIMSKNEKFQKLLEINERLGGVPDLVSPTRELVKEGRIIKLSARNGQQLERHIFLFNDILLLCTPVAVGLTRQTHKVSHKLSIDGMSVSEGDNLETPNTFYVKNKQKLLELHCEGEDDKVAWQMAFWGVIHEYLKKKQTRGQAKDLSEEFSLPQEVGRTPPKWIKDQEASQCMLCGTSFTMIKRRHHCRGCGKVVCGKCSQYQARLEYMGSDKPTRVCYRCYSSLMQRDRTAAGIDVISGPVEPSSPQLRSRRILQVSAIEGTLVSGYMMMSQDRRTWTRRWFAVHKDFVLYSFKAPQDPVALTSLPLPGYVAMEAEARDNLVPERPLAFKVMHTPLRKVYFFTVENRDVLDKWLNVLLYVVKAELPPQFQEKEIVSDSDGKAQRESFA